MKTAVVLVLVFAALCAAIGESFLSYGMRPLGHVSWSSPSQWPRLVLMVVRNPHVTVGVLFLACFFFLYLVSLSWTDLSFALPVTNLSLVFAALIARYVLREQVSWQRWLGTVIILIGITFIALDQKAKTVPVSPEAAAGVDAPGGPRR